MSGTKSFVSAFLAFIAYLCSLFNVPFFPVGEKVDMDKFTLTFADEFDGTQLSDSWTGHYQYGDTTAVRVGCYWNKNLAEVKDGKLTLPVVYLEDGMGGKGPGWYSVGIDTSSRSANPFLQRYGYFECRCKIPEGADIWSAFWLYCPGVCNEDGEGEDGTEIDIFESKKGSTVTHCLHYNGYGAAHKCLGAQEFRVQKNPHKSFNTYGVEWNENEYIFYINGKESMRTSYGGVSKVPEFPVLSVEMKGENGVPSGRKNEKGPGTEFVVDYVRIYQYKDLIG